MVTRRDFLKNITVLSVAAPSVLTAPLGFAGSTGTRKALVCVLLDGGNDAANMVVPTSETHYQTYFDVRPDLALAKEQLLPVPATGRCRDNLEVSLGLHPKMTKLAEVFANREASVIVNSGILREPLTKEEAETQGYRLPPFLFSHNSQKNEWEKGAVGYSLTTGWAGRLMDVLHQDLSGTNLAPLYSHAGETQLLRANTLNQNIIRGKKITELNANTNTVTALDDYFAAVDGDAFDQTLASVGKDSIHVANTLMDVIDSIADEDDVPLYPDTGLGTQFRMTSRLIRKSAELNQGTQIFFLQLGGFDTHADQNRALNEKYAELSDAMAAFNAHLKLLGLHDNVITVTHSDFGRRIPANGTGTDHGWGGHQIVMGGAIDGSAFIGTWPDYRPEGPDAVERGRLLPTIAADQVYIALARWLGASDATIRETFPNHANFAPLDLTRNG